MDGIPSQLPAISTAAPTHISKANLLWCPWLDKRPAARGALSKEGLPGTTLPWSSRSCSEDNLRNAAGTTTSSEAFPSTRHSPRQAQGAGRPLPSSPRPRKCPFKTLRTDARAQAAALILLLQAAGKINFHPSRPAPDQRMEVQRRERKKAQKAGRGQRMGRSLEIAHKYMRSSDARSTPSCAASSAKGKPQRMWLLSPCRASSPYSQPFSDCLKSRQILKKGSY